MSTADKGDDDLETVEPVSADVTVAQSELLLFPSGLLAKSTHKALSLLNCSSHNSSAVSAVVSSRDLWTGGLKEADLRKTECWDVGGLHGNEEEEEVEVFLLLLTSVSFNLEGLLVESGKFWCSSAFKKVGKMALIACVHWSMWSCKKEKRNWIFCIANKFSKNLAFDHAKIIYSLINWMSVKKSQKKRVKNLQAVTKVDLMEKQVFRKYFCKVV